MSISLIPALFVLFSVVGVAVIAHALFRASTSWQQLQRDWAALEVKAAEPAATFISVHAANPKPITLRTHRAAAPLRIAPMQAAA